MGTNRKLQKFTVHEAAIKLGTTPDEVRRASRGLKFGVSVTGHLDEKQVFELAKWLHRNPKPGLTWNEATSFLECTQDELQTAIRHRYHKMQTHVPEADLKALGNWIRNHLR